MGVETKVYAACKDCRWQPDPKRRMTVDSQAEEHTKTAGHVTVTTTTPVR